MGWVIGPECAVLLRNRLHHSWYFPCSSGDGNWHYSVILLHRCRGAQRQCHVCSPFAHRNSELPCPLSRGSWGSTCLEETAESCQQKITLLRKFWSYLSNLLCLETDLVVVFILLYTSSWVLYFLSSKKWSGYFEGVRVANGQLQNLGVLGRNNLHIRDSIRVAGHCNLIFHHCRKKWHFLLFSCKNDHSQHFFCTSCIFLWLI